MTASPDPVITVSALGASVALRCESRLIARCVQEAWGDAILATGPRSHEAELTVGLSPHCDVTGSDVSELLHHLSPAVTTSAIAVRAGELVMLHAAALAHPRSGLAAILVAPSGTGKTTAATTLGRRLHYLTDETAGVTQDGLLVPYRKPLSIIRTGRFKDQVSPSDLGLLISDNPSHLGAILILNRHSGHQGQPDVCALPTINAIAALAPQASSLGRLSQPLHRLVQLIDRVGGVRQVTYAEAATLAPVLDSLLWGASV